MLDMKPELHFEPSKTTKTLWRYVRKSPATFAGVTLPGLFQCTNFALDTFGFAAVLVLEVWGLANLLRVGQMELTFVIFLFALDVVFAVFRHLPVGGICERENRLVVVDDPAAKENLHSEIQRLRMIVRLFTLLMLCVALFKVVSFQALQGGVFNGLTAAILVSYLITWVLHISATSYFLFGLVTAAFLRYDQVRFLRGGHSRPVALSVTTHRRHPFRSKVRVEAVRVYKHSLEPVPLAEDAYELRTWGLLTDDQLHSLIGAQVDSEAKWQIAVQGLTHQLDILQSAPPRSEESGATPGAKVQSAGTMESDGANGRITSQTVWNSPPAVHVKSMIAVLGLSAVTMIGCTKPQPQGGSYQTFPLTIVLTHSVTPGPQDTASEDLLKIALPFAGTSCSLVFFPQVSFVRLDHDPGSRIQLEQVDLSEVETEAEKRRAQSSFGRIRSFYGQRPSVEELREVVSPMLKNVAVWNTLAAPGDRALDMKDVLSFPRQAETTKIFVLTQSAAEGEKLVEQIRAALLPHQEVVGVTDEEKLAELTGAYLCEHAASAAGRERSADAPAVVVLYKPTVAQHDVVPEGGESPVSESPQPAPVVPVVPQEELRHIRKDLLEQGRFRDARQALASLATTYPQDQEVGRLQEEIEQSVKGYIELRVRGENGGRYVTDSSVTIVGVGGESFRLYVEPHEEMYVYLYLTGDAGKTKRLFPDSGTNSTSDPLRPGQAYWLPFLDRDKSYPFHRDGRRVQEVYIISSRWPARELEQMGREPAAKEEETDRHLLQALKERHEAKMGGCDVRVVKFAGQAQG